ncbi:FAD-binding oxidoreductase [Calidifontibacter terrae]
MTLLEDLCTVGEARRGTDDEAYDGAVPQLIARATSTEQLSGFLAATHAAGATVAVRGNGSKLTWGSAAPTPDVVVDLRAMNSVLEHQPGDLIVAAQAGCSLATLNAHVATGGQRLAVDEVVSGTTVGGLVATNPSGPLRQLAGTTRDLLIGITVVLADGTIARAGGKVVKNVAGYDLGKLMVGSYGTLAAIADATFRLHPVPRAQAWVTATVDNGLETVLREVTHTQDAPSALELHAEPGCAITLAVHLEGTEAGVEHRARRVADLIGGQIAARPDWTHSYPWRVGIGTGLKITCALSAVAQVAAEARALGWILQGSFGAGVLHAAVPDGLDLPEISHGLRGLRAAARGGSVVVLDAPRAVRENVDVWGPIPNLELMRRVKDQFDPDHLLTPGRFVGGI